MRAAPIVAVIAFAAFSFIASGCYEDSGSSTPQAQKQPSVQQEGPLTGMGNQPASSALGKAKQSAKNIADRAEQKSRQDADQADDPLNDHPKKDPAPGGDPSLDPG